MSRVQLALDVDDLEAAVTFYAALLGTEPAKRRPGYANFAVVEPPLKLVLIENPGSGGTLNHLGVEVADPAEVRAHQERLARAGLLDSVEQGTTCCYAVQDKVWATAPDGERWEHYAVLAHTDTHTDAHTDAQTDADADARAGARAGAATVTASPAAAACCA